MHIEMLIAGHRIGGPCDQSVGKEIVRNPYDGSVVGTVAEGGWSELSTCLAAAKDAFELWRQTSLAERAERLGRIAENIEAHREELVQLAVLEIGKPVTIADAEVSRAVLTFRLAAEAAVKFKSGEGYGEPQDVTYDPRSEGARAFVRRVPRGVILGITPYNWPYNLTAHKVAASLAAGNTIVIKPSPLAAASTMRFIQIIHEAGLADGVVNVWNGPTPLVAKALRDPRLAYLSFTGSSQVGWKLRREYPNLPMTLELGGNAPAIITQTADLDLAVSKLVHSAYAYAGQVCISLQNIFVEESVADTFAKRWQVAVDLLKTGDPRETKTIVGPMISAEAADRVLNLITAAVEKGAKLQRETRREGNLLWPVTLMNVPPDSDLMTSEAFGPVVTMMTYQNVDNVLKTLRDSRHAIHASIFTQDEADVAKALSIDYPGWVVNDAPSLRFDKLPYGGERESGWGREGVEYAMNELTFPQSLVIRNL
jgi:acyl-CoA reductase-like NAD-dependent aldehyde dehydrogenase